MTAQMLDSLVQEDYPLRDLNTFRLKIKAKYFAEIDSEECLERLLDERPLGGQKFLVLGHGSNLLFSSDYDGLVLWMRLKGKRVVREDDDQVVVDVWGGEDWSELVRYAVDRGWGGIENLAMVPGAAATVPIQNLACYGQNLVDVFVSLDAVDLTAGTLKTFTEDECAFCYRDSKFRSPEGRKYLVTKVRLSLSTQPVGDTSYHSRYESIKQELRTVKDPPYKIRDVYQTVCNIRSRKLPDLGQVGSAGSFFKNPVVKGDKVRELRKMLPDLQVYPVDQLLYPQRGELRVQDQDRLKVPAGWLLEEMGWKGKTIGNCGLWPSHALVVVNYGEATPGELLGFVEAVREAFFQRYGIRLENEVDVV